MIQIYQQHTKYIQIKIIYLLSIKLRDMYKVKDLIG